MTWDSLMLIGLMVVGLILIYGIWVVEKDNDEFEL